jgi:uncharacterized membrane protein (GlpM family)
MSVQEIPIRATILSAMSVIPYFLVLVALFLLDLSVDERGLVVRLLFYVLVVCRCPLTTFVIFATNRQQLSRQENNVPSLSFVS